MCAILGAELPAVVISPASLILNWRKEIDLWRPEAADQFTVLSYADRKLGAIDPDNMAHLYNTVIGDEIHFIKSARAARSVQVCGLIAAIRQRGKAIALSGTIIPNRPIELWPLLWSMGITKKNYYSFGRRYAEAWKAPWGWEDRGSSNEGELRKVLEPHLIRFTKAQVLPQLPPKTWRVIALDLPTPAQEKRFDLGSLAELEESLAFEALSDVLKLHGERKVPKSLEYIETVLADTPKVVVFAHHRDVVSRLAEKLAHHRPVTVVGGTSKKRKQEAVDAFQGDSSVRVIIGQGDAMGVGHTLTAASHVVMVEGSWVPGDLQQRADRCHRIGQQDNVTVDLLTIDGSIDEHMIRRAIKKQETVDLIVPTSRHASALW
jgi:SWI/SNF-related matrix-associated actin-dependent regulator 1 of chromatin subfamily A